MAVEIIHTTAVALPEKVLNQCGAKAKACGKKMEDWIADRLRACIHHDAKRGLYFSDAQREALEQLMGGVMLGSADDALRLLTSRFTLAVGDEKAIPVEEGVYTVLKQRSEELKVPLPQIIREAVANGLSYSAYGGY